MCITAWKDQGNLEYKLSSVITSVVTCGKCSKAVGFPPRSPLPGWFPSTVAGSIGHGWHTAATSLEKSPLANESGLVQRCLGSYASTIPRWPDVNG